MNIAEPANLKIEKIALGMTSKLTKSRGDHYDTRSLMRDSAGGEDRMPLTDHTDRLTHCQTRLVMSLMILFCLMITESPHVPSAFAATFYVDNACAINGDGTSTTCGPNGPWNRLNKAKHCAGMRPGDTMEIRAGRGVYREGAWEPQASCQGITIQNYPGEDAVLDGTADISGSTWTPIGSGVYQCTAGKCGTRKKFPFTAWYVLDDGIERRLNLIQSKRTCDTSLAPGEMRYTTTHQVCAHTIDGSSPAKADYFRIPMVHAGIQLTLTQVDHLTLRSHPSGQGRFRIQRFRDHGINSQTTSQAITYDGLDIGWVMDRCINQSEGGLSAANYQIVNNRIHHCGQEGIRWSQDVSPTGLVAHNEVFDIQSEPVFERCFPNCLSGFVDNGTGIRVLSHHGAVRHNRVYNIGGGKTGRSYGINLENGTPGIRVESNYIYNMNHGLTGPRNGQAILLSSTGSQSYAGVVIQNNRIHNVDVCFAFDIGDQMPTGDTVHLLNNTCNDPAEYGLDMQDGDYKTTIHIVNNIFRAVNTTPTLLINVPWRHSRGFQTPLFNSYYCPTCVQGGGDLVYWKGWSYERDGDCRSGINCIADLDPTNHYGDPNLDMSGPLPSLHIRSPRGAAYQRGGTAGTPTDYRGQPRKPSPDIGAHEWRPTQ